MKIKRLFVLLLLVLSMGLTTNAQTYNRSGNTFISSTGEQSKPKPTKTKFTWKDNKGKEYPVYISSKGSCFIIKGVNKDGKEDRRYLGPEISQQICKELNVEYKGKKNKL